MVSNNGNLLSHDSGSQKSKIRCWHSWFLLKTLKNLFHASLLVSGGWLTIFVVSLLQKNIPLNSTLIFLWHSPCVYVYLCVQNFYFSWRYQSHWVEPPNICFNLITSVNTPYFQIRSQSEALELGLQYLFESDWSMVNYLKVSSRYKFISIITLPQHVSEGIISNNILSSLLMPKEIIPYKLTSFWFIYIHNEF